MASIVVGDILPDGELAWLDESDQLHMIPAHWLAAGKKVVLFGVSRAFTPICSMKHVPDFIESAEELKSKGVNEILVISVNDPFVTKAWTEWYPKNRHVKFLADDSGTYTHALGLALDLSDKGLGTRLRRFVLLIDDLVVTVANIKEGREFTLGITVFIC
ncbi:peroxiredoxin-2B-like [Zingiber officinale]|uniref:Glutaredoxin-dependent peroxiredoxin n=1 Tax=Zingiber officinale TaxID=94328 RepID=A0A8J5GWY1_ZINOF|nr:peroxiredoxin-2B-like [Zingiber officinale]KAG6514482.1 hypothetical protein ZIOFF_024842 [Zingiber officinale]